MDLSAYKAINIDNITMKKIVINDTIEWKREPVNLVPTSIDTAGSIYNGTGYIEGYRLSSVSSGGVLKAQANTVTSGFIKASQNDIVRMIGTKWSESSEYNYFAMYDENFNILATINHNPDYGNYLDKGWSYKSGVGVDTSNTYVYMENNITTFDIAMEEGYSYAYIRISAYGSGTDMFITVNEEIE